VDPAKAAAEPFLSKAGGRDKVVFGIKITSRLTRIGTLKDLARRLEKNTNIFGKNSIVFSHLMSVMTPTNCFHP
jgi:hypothetical protein